MGAGKKILTLLLVAVLCFGILQQACTTAVAEDKVPTVVWGTGAVKGGLTGENYDTPTYVYFGSYPQTNNSSITLTGNYKDGDVETVDGKAYMYLSNPQISAFGNWYLIEPISWAVLSTTPTGKKAGAKDTGEEYNDEEYAALSSWQEGDGLFLLTEYELEPAQYHTDVEGYDDDDERLYYANSTLRSWLNGYAASYNIGDNAGQNDPERSENKGIDYSTDGDNFISVAFTDREKQKLLDTVIDNPDTNAVFGTAQTPYTLDGGNALQDYVFAIKLEDVTAYANVGSGSGNVWHPWAMGSATSRYAAAKSGSFQFGLWWLRDNLTTDSWSSEKGILMFPNTAMYVNYVYWPAEDWYKDGKYQYTVPEEGYAYYGKHGVSNNGYARPAINLNTENVLFVSSAARDASKTLASGNYLTFSGNNVSAKSETGMDTALTALSTEDKIYSWKFTMKDTNYGTFKAETVAIDVETGSITVQYSGAKTGANEYISVLVKDAEFSEDPASLTDAEAALEKDGDFVYYGRIKDLSKETSGSGTATIALGDGIDLAGKTVYVYNENYTGETSTDYASNLVPVKCFAVQYNANNDDSTAEPVSEFYFSGENAPVSDNNGSVTAFTKKGYKYTGWNTLAQPTTQDEGIAYTSDDTISLLRKNMKLYAQWEEGENYTLTYETNAGTDVVDASGDAVTRSGNANQEKVYKNDIVKLRERITTRASYAFTGWHLDASLDTHIPNQELEIEGDATVYAGWGFEIMFDPNGGTMETPDGNVVKDNRDGTYSVHVTEGKSVSEPDAPSRSGYTFEGWYTEPSGGTKWDFAGDTAADHLTLYAHWRSTTRYTVIAKAGEGGSISPSGSTTVYAGEDAVFSITADDGYSLADVLVDGVSVGPKGSCTFEKVSADHTIEALFEKTVLPQTGDGSNPTLWIGLLMCAALGLFFLEAGRKKRERAS